MEFTWRFTLTNEEYSKCLKFSEMSAKSQRENRSGGIMVREVGQISQDTLRGKVGEIIVKKFLEQSPLKIEGINLDFDIYPRGKWDDADLKLNNQSVSIKSAKWFSKWLLLEKKDIDRGDLYDFYILVLVDKDFKSGTIKGYALRDDILNGKDTLQIPQGDFIPGTNTVLDASNYARNSANLKNLLGDWKKFSIKLNS
jgi:hypothetical protein